MYNEFKIAWRNLWRNRRRTGITVAAVVLAVFLCTFMSSMQEGTYARMIDNIVKFYSGYIQVQDTGYWESKSINDSFIPDSLFPVLAKTEGITHTVSRLESFTLASSGEDTRGCALIGIDPEGEDKLTGLSKWIQSGSYLEKGQDGILLAVNLAANLNVRAGDTLILISQGYHGASASALVPVRGVLKFPSPQLNGFGAYMDISRARDFFGAPGRSTSIAIMVRDYRSVKSVTHRLHQSVGSHYAVKTWDEMQPDLVKMIQGDRAGAVVMKGILYLVVGFGMFGTIIMMMVERRKEMGVLIAVGMRRFKLQRILGLESFLMGIIGIAAGILISLPFIALMVSHPLQMGGNIGRVYESFGLEPALFFSLIPRVFVNQAITLFIISMGIAIYPWFIIRKLNLINALHGK